MSNRPLLDPDWLGDKGEKRFAELCADGQLICNKSDRDRAGWDFVIDFPDFGDQDISLDARVAPISCHVQVKTIRHTTSAVSLKLNMAERLAKEPKPSFIFILKVDGNFNFSDAFLIPLLNDRLASVLKRLRKEQAAHSGVALNKKTISFTPMDDERIALSGASLRDAIKTHCGDDTQKYIHEKHRQLKQLGFTDRATSIHVKFNTRDRNLFFDAMLGLEKNIPISRFELRQTRFGIELPVASHTNTTVSIVPQSLGKGTILVRPSESRPPVIINCDVFATPIWQGARRIQMRHALFTFDFDLDIQTGVNVDFESPETDVSCSINDWLDFWRLTSFLSGQTGVFEFSFSPTSKSIEVDFGKSDFKFKNEGPDPAIGIRVFAALKQILERIGIAFAPKFTYGEVMSAYNNIVLLSEFIKGTQPNQLQVADDETVPVETLKPGAWIVANAFSVGTILIAYYGTAIAQFEENCGRRNLVFKNLMLKKTRIIDDVFASYNNFIADAQFKERLENVLQLNTPEIDSTSVVTQFT